MRDLEQAGVTSSIECGIAGHTYHMVIPGPEHPQIIIEIKAPRLTYGPVPRTLILHAAEQLSHVKLAFPEVKTVLAIIAEKRDVDSALIGRYGVDMVGTSRDQILSYVLGVLKAQRT